MHNPLGHQSSIWSRLVQPSSRIADELGRRQAQLFQGMVVIVFPVIFLVGIVVLPIMSGAASLWISPTFLPASTALIVSIISFLLSRGGRIMAAMVLYAVMFVVCPAIAVIQDTSVANLPIGTLMIGGAVVAAALFQDMWVSTAFVLLVLAGSVMIPAVNPVFTFSDVASLIAANFTNGILIVIFSLYRSEQEKERRAALERAYGELRESKRFSDMVIDNLPGIFYICDEQGRLVRWNNTEKIRTGYSPQELVQMNLLRLFHRDRELMASHLHDVLERGRSSVEASIETKSGEAIPVYVTGFRIVAEGKRYAVGVGVDISERTKLEKQLFQAKKMESIGRLASGIAHDFNNALAAIVGYVNLLQLRIHDDVQSREYVNHTLAATERAAGLTQSLLAFSRKQVINPRNIDLNDCIRKTGNLLARIIGEDITLTPALCSEMLTIYADITQIEQVLMNLATNARDAMPNGGRLTIKTERAILDDDDVRAWGYGQPGNYAVLMVSDTGQGMDVETQKKIFDPFFTTKELGKGTGLGLAIVYGIVKQNNGYINVHSEAASGTTFQIYLPLVSSRPAEDQPPEVEQLIRGGTETILVAEDNETVRRLTSGVLRENGYTVIEAADGDEALSMIQEHRDRIKLVVLDVIMPKKSGRMVYEEAQRLGQHVKALFTSGYPTDLIQKEGILEKGLHFLPKPSSPQSLLRKVREILDS